MRLTRWRVLRLRLALEPSGLLPQPVKLAAGVVAIMGAGAGLVLVSGAVEVGPIVAAAFAAGAVAFVVDRVPRLDRWRDPMLRVDDHPRLAQMAADAARVAGYDSPPRVRLTALASVRADRRWRGTPELLLGPPLLMGLSAPDLHALMVRELLAVKLWRPHEYRAVHLFPFRAT
ncbi:hypothetical protein [Nonomuraea turcica]|uniref:hypothetical protein n=1 Tax=Nonomuraea sp. G32 TaxID=3067274 RepID=UPI00273C878B|nr:hypothetical protein [Nonomuraea sp. G32]MDP4508185.1 hypothetical protein [Nonomuraea sp. G32]